METAPVGLNEPLPPTTKIGPNSIPNQREETTKEKHNGWHGSTTQDEFSSLEGGLNPNEIQSESPSENQNETESGDENPTKRSGSESPNGNQNFESESQEGSQTPKLHIRNESPKESDISSGIDQNQHQNGDTGEIRVKEIPIQIKDTCERLDDKRVDEDLDDKCVGGDLDEKSLGDELFEIDLDEENLNSLDVPPVRLSESLTPVADDSPWSHLTPPSLFTFISSSPRPSPLPFESPSPLPKSREQRYNPPPKTPQNFPVTTRVPMLRNSPSQSPPYDAPRSLPLSRRPLRRSPPCLTLTSTSPKGAFETSNFTLRPRSSVPSRRHGSNFPLVENSSPQSSPALSNDLLCRRSLKSPRLTPSTPSTPSSVPNHPMSSQTNSEEDTSPVVELFSSYSHLPFHPQSQTRARSKSVKELHHVVNDPPKERVHSSFSFVPEILSLPSSTDSPPSTSSPSEKMNSLTIPTIPGKLTKTPQGAPYITRPQTGNISVPPYAPAVSPQKKPQTYQIPIYQPQNSTGRHAYSQVSPRSRPHQQQLAANRSTSQKSIGGSPPKKEFFPFSQQKDENKGVVKRQERGRVREGMKLAKFSSLPPNQAMSSNFVLSHSASFSNAYGSLF